jgi:hypothetical protein
MESNMMIPPTHNLIYSTVFGTPPLSPSRWSGK